MHYSFSKFGIAFRSTIPALFTVVLMVIFTLPVNLPYLNLMPLVIAASAVYYWSIYRPELMPIGAVFIIGMVHDFFSDGPLAVVALALLALHLVTLTQRETLAGRSFLVIWLGFVLMAPILPVMLWVILMLYHGQILHPSPFFFVYFAAILIFPLIAEVFNIARIRLFKI